MRALHRNRNLVVETMDGLADFLFWQKSRRRFRLKSVAYLHEDAIFA